MKKDTLLSYGFGLSITALLFLLIAMTQMNEVKAAPQPSAPDSPVVSLPAPENIILDEPKPEEATFNIDFPDASDRPHKETPIKPLDIGLTLTTGKTTPTDLLNPGRLVIGDVTNDSFFEPTELDELPTLVQEGKFRKPMRKVRHENVVGQARVEVKILPDGKLEIIRILECSPEAYRNAVEAFVRSSRFSSPTVSGQSVTARYVWKVNFPVN